jgi:hypothetical protein
LTQKGEKMAQTTDSQPTHPVIVFQVNLETQNRYGHLVPNSTTLTGNQTVSEADQLRNTRSTYIPGLTGAENLLYKHGDTFTVKGQKATYLKKTHVSSPASPNDLLSIVSES